MNDKLRVLIVDDEPLARERIRRLLEDEPAVEMVGEAFSGAEALRGMRELRPDLVLLDIEMPDMSGFDVLREIGPEHAPAVIFVTAYDEYAIDAFEVHALDYLLKPFDDDRFRSALQRARSRRPSDEADVHARLARLLEGVEREARRPDQIAVRIGSRYVFHTLSEITHAEASGNYTRAHFGGEKSVLLRRSLSDLHELLDPGLFLRIHRSTLVNVSCIRAVEPTFRGEYVIFLHDGTRLTSGRTYRKSIQQLLQNAG
jgi:two-component system, LytTR family, response regulator